MAVFNLLISESQPASFAERGVAVPFTAPLLAGARIRNTSRSGIELVVPNPSGGRGVYILPWATAQSLCRPTVHDSRLYEELRRLPKLTPSSVRLAARIVATEGLAGQEAQDAAIAAAANDAAAQLRTASLLWMGLRSAALPGFTPEMAARELDALGTVLTPLGLPPDADAARLPQLMAALTSVGADIDAWARMNAAEDIAALAARVSVAAAEAVAIAGPLVQDARALATDVPGLLHYWIHVPARLASRISRTEWLLDGWERIILLWRDAAFPATQRTTLLEMAQLVPDLPPEAAGWRTRSQSTPQPAHANQVAGLTEGWRTGSASFSLVARNERLRTLGA